MKTLGALSLSTLLMVSSPALTTAVVPSAIQGVAGPGIQACALRADGVLSAELAAPNSVRYIFYDRNGKWIGEQWTSVLLRKPFQRRLLASPASLEQSEIATLHCDILTQLRACNQWLIVDEGPAIDLTSLLFTRDSVSAQFTAYYSNFFSTDFQLQDELFYIQLDDRPMIEPIVTDTKEQPLTIHFADTKPGKHKLSYGVFQWDLSKDPPSLERVGSQTCFSTVSG